MKNKYFFLAIFILGSIWLQAQVVLPYVEEFQVTSTPAYETTPTLGNDGISDLVVFSTQPYDPVNNYVYCNGEIFGDIWYQRLMDGSSSGAPVQVSSTATHEDANDVWGDYIVYIAYDNCNGASGTIILYKISTATSYPLFSAEVIYSCHIHNKWVVWQEGEPFSAKIMLYNVDWLGTGLSPVIIAGPNPPTFQVEIGDRFVVWTEYIDGQFDVVVRDLEDATTYNISNTPLMDDNRPSTFGSWVVWTEWERGTESSRIIAMNLDTWQTKVIVDNGARNLNPTISGDLIVWLSTVNVNADLFAYRFSTGETYQITTQLNDQYLNDVFGNLIVYADNRNGGSDIYLTEIKAGTYIPDDNFEQALIDLGYDDVLDDYVLTSNISEVTSLFISSKGIVDLTGIEDFTSLTSLDCRFNHLTELELSQNTALKSLMCAGNQLNILDLTYNTALTYVLCSNNQIVDLNVNQCTDLKNLYCSSNSLAHLNVSANPDLLRLDCGMNQLTEIDISGNTVLQEFYCHSNQLSVLNLNNNTDLSKLICENNQLSVLDISNNLLLYTLNCGKNQLTSLNVQAHQKLEELQCHYNQLIELDLSQNPYLSTILCFVNDLVYLDVRNGANENITTFSAFANELTCVNVDDELAVHSSWNVDAGVIFSNDCGYNTQQGEDVVVRLEGPVKMTEMMYSKVDISGETSLEVRTEDIVVSDGYQTLDPSKVYDITTTALYSGEIIIELDYSEYVVENEEALRMLHFEEAVWVDITKEVLTEKDILVGVTTSLSPFLIVLDVQPPVINCNAYIIVNNDPGAAGAVVSFTDPVATDNSSEVTTEQTDGLGFTSGSFFPIGTTTLSYLATDGAGNTATCSFNVVVNNPVPVINEIVAPVDPIALGILAHVEVYYTDNNLDEATINWGDGSVIEYENISTQPIIWEHNYTAAGVYPVSITLIDMGGEITEEIYRYIVVYDPTEGFVTGGGWIFSPEGAYKPEPLLTGKASFGFVSKYKKGSTVPDGNTEFQFKTGNLNFKSTVYEWLVIAGSKALFKGSGTINDFGNYGFLLTIIDADLTPSAVTDKFRIKIWDKDNNDDVVYDNNLEIDDNADPTTEIVGGSIIIHTSNTKSTEIEPGLISAIEKSNISVYPNPFDDRLHFEFVSPVDVHARIDIFDITGRKVKTIFNEFVSGGVNYNTEFVPLSEVSNTYLYRVTLGESIFNGKVIYKKR